MYISVTQKVLKSCRSKMATLAHDVCDVHGASSLYVKKFFHIYIYIYIYRAFPTGGWGESSPDQPKIFSSAPPHQKPIQPNKKDKKVIFSLVIAPVPILF